MQNATVTVDDSGAILPNEFKFDGEPAGRDSRDSLQVHSPKTFKRELCSTGLHNALCIGVHSIGVQPSGKFEPKEQLLLSFEIDEKMTTGKFAGKPFRLYKKVTKSLNDKATLTKILQGWAGKDPRRRPRSRSPTPHAPRLPPMPLRPRRRQRPSKPTPSPMPSPLPTMTPTSA